MKLKLLFVFLCLFYSFTNVYAQRSAIEFSTLVGGNSYETPVEQVVYKGDVYVVGTTQSADFPTTDGSTLSGSVDVFLVRYNDSGKVVFAKLIGGVNSENIVRIVIKDDYIYLAGSTRSADFPTTNPDIGPRGISDAFAMKLDLNGNIVYSSVFGGSRQDGNIHRNEAYADVVNDEFYFSTQTLSNFDYPMVTNLLGGANYVINKMDANGILVNASALSGFRIGPVSPNSFLSISRSDSNFYSVHYTRLNSDTATNGSTQSPLGSSQADLLFTNYDKDLNVKHTAFIGGTFHEGNPRIESVNHETYILATSRSSDYPVTDGSVKSANSSDFVLTKLDSVGNIIYAKYLGAGFGTYDLIYDNGYLYFIGGSNPNNFPPTISSTGSTMVGKIDAATGNIVYTRYIESYEGKLEVNNNNLYIFSSSFSSSFNTSTNGTVIEGSQSQTLTKLDANGRIVYVGFVGGSSNDDLNPLITNAVSTSGDTVYTFGNTGSTDFTITDTINKLTSNATLTKIVFCPEGYDVSNDTLSPSVQNACANGFVQQIRGRRISIPGDSLPIVYKNGNATTQPDVLAFYQWQEASSITGPWVDIPGGIGQNYTPLPSASTKYYRRISRMGECCDFRPIDTSSVASIVINSFNAPTVDAGGVFNTCPNSPVTIGGSPVATGGMPPYTYSWSNISTADSALANPSVSPASGSVYTVTVTDSNGCIQIGQALVNTFQAEAGMDVSACDGDSVLLEAVPLAGISGVTYSWSPTLGLSNPNIAQPKALPTTDTTYYITMTIPVTGGGNCSTIDSVNVRNVAAPVTANFAGNDTVICLGSTVNIGRPAEAGFTYTWSPGTYLNNNFSAQVNYNPGNLSLPSPNAGTYTVTAARDGCFFIDQVTVATINADASGEGCGPTTLGNASRSDAPNLNETFNWTVVSGPGIIIGSTNGPTANISGDTVPTIYQLTTTYNGVSCTDMITVGSPACVCGVDIIPTATFGCPTSQHGTVQLTAEPAIGNASDYTYSWSPMVGLSSYNSATVTLTDTVARNYTVTVRNTIDTTLVCSSSILVNQPSMSTLPVFNTINDTAVCFGDSINLGETAVAGYGYRWSPSMGLNSITASNPRAEIEGNQTYTVTVTDSNSGCFIMDEVNVSVLEVLVDAGDDQIICTPTTVMLGTPAEPNIVYSWTPSTASFQNGTTDSSAQVEILVSINTTFILKATDTLLGCSSFDTVEVMVNSSPTIPNFPDQTICVGTSQIIGSTAIPGVSYSWSSPSGTGDLSDTNIAQPTITPTMSATYTVSATFPPGTCVVTDQVVVTVSDANFTLNDTTFCPSGAPFFLGNSAPVGMTSYSWSPFGSVSATNIRNPQTTLPLPTSTFNFALTVINSDGCSATDVLTITPIIDPPNAGNDQTICANTSTQIGSSINATGPGITYSWTPATDLSSTTDPTPTFTPTTAGVYTFFLTKTELGCSITDSIVVTVTDNPLPTATSANICAGSSAPIGVPNQSGIQYFWSPGGTLNDSTIAMPTASPLVTTSYTLTAVDQNGCVSTETAIVSVSTIPAPVIDLVDTITVCEGVTDILFNPSVSPVGSYTYIWSPNDGSISNINILNPTIIIGNVGDKTYTLTATNTDGCSSQDSVVLSVEVPMLEIFCKDTTVYLDANGMVSWDTSYVIIGISDNCGVDSVWLSDTNATCANDTINYTVFVRDVFGNMASCENQIFVLDTLNPTISCNDTTVYLDATGNVMWDTSYLNLSLNDNCGIDSVWMSIDSALCSNDTVMVTTYVRDNSMNIDSCISEVIVLDTLNPTISCNDTTVYLDATGNVMWDTSYLNLTLNDNCGIDSVWMSIDSALCSNDTVMVTTYVRDNSMNIDSCISEVIVLDTLNPTISCNDTTVYLDANGNVMWDTSYLSLTLNDNCGIDSVWMSIDSALCSNDTVMVTTYVRDNSMNIDSCTSEVIVLDTLNPTISCNDTTVYLDATGNVMWDTSYLNLSLNDNCGIDSVWMSIDSALCSNDTVMVTTYVRDNSMNIDSCISEVIVLDTIIPTISCNDTTVYLDATGNVMWDTSYLNLSLNDNCGIDSVWMSIDSALCSNDTVRVTTYVRDNSMNIDSCISEVIVLDTLNPTISCNDTTVYLDANGNVMWDTSYLSLTLNDNCGIDSVWMSIDSALCSNDTVMVTTYVRDNSMNIDSCISEVIVLDTLNPTISCNDTTVYLDANGNVMWDTSYLNLTLNDNCGIDSVWMSIDSALCSNDTVMVTTYVRDNSMNIDSCISEVIVLDTVKPTVLCKDTILYVNNLGQASITANDLDSATTDNCNFSLSISQTNFDCNDIGVQDVWLVAIDSSGNTDSCLSRVTIIDSSLNNQVFCLDTTVYLDNNNTSIITPTHVFNYPTGICTTIDSVWMSDSTFTCLDLGVNTISVYYRNNYGVIDSCMSNVVVIDTIAPTAVCQDITAQLDANGMVQITASDIDGGSSDGCGFISLSISDSIFNCGDTGTQVVTLYIRDASNNVDSCQANVTIEDNIAPTIICPSNRTDTIISSLCNYIIEDYRTDIVQLSDNCTDTDSLIVTQSPTPGQVIDASNSPFIQTITIRVEDEHGNADECMFDIEIVCLPFLKPNEFISPNGDGKNDLFVIEGIERFPDNKLMIYNRWGALIYEQDNYQNTWDASLSKGTVIVDSDDGFVPDGTYFYVLELNDDNQQQYKGYVQVQR